LETKVVRAASEVDRADLPEFFFDLRSIRRAKLERIALLPKSMQRQVVERCVGWRSSGP
jgi:hypothetical protein